MRTFLPFFLRVSCAFLAFFTCLTTVRAAERLPGQLVAHVAVASPEKFISDLDRTLSVALDGIKDTGYSPGMISLLAMFGSPLPVGAWDIKSEVHLLVEARRREEPSVAVIFSAESLDKIAVALGQRDKLVNVGEETVLQATLTGIRRPVHMIELGDGRVLATPNPKALLRLKRVVAEWNPPGVTGDGIRLRVDAANILGLLATEYESALDELRRQSIRDTNSVLAAIERGREVPDGFFITTDQVKSILRGYPAFIDRVIRAGDTIVKSVGVLDLTVDVAGEKLRLAFSLSALDGTPLREHIEKTQSAAQPEFLFADMIPENASHYGYFMDPSGLNRQILSFVMESLDEYLGDALPDVLSYLSRVTDGFLALGSNASGGGLFLGNDGEMVDALFSRWDNTELLLQNLDELSALIESDAAMESMQNLFRTMGARLRDGSRRTSEDWAWFDGMANGELVPDLRVALEKREDDAGGAPYYRFHMTGSLHSLFPPSFHYKNFIRVRDILDRAFRRFDFIIAERNGVIVTTIGNVRDEEDAVRLNRLFGTAGEGTKSLASKAAAADAGYPRQNSFQMINLLETGAYYAAEQLDLYLVDQPTLRNAIERLIKSINVAGSYVYLYSGARDDSFVTTIDIPARSVNVAARAVIDMMDEIKRIEDALERF